MKKRVEAELISIAHRILKLKNKSEWVQLHLETQKLYETLSVMRFVEENSNLFSPKIDSADIEQKLAVCFDVPIASDTPEAHTMVEPLAGIEAAEKSDANEVLLEEEKTTNTHTPKVLTVAEEVTLEEHSATFQTKDSIPVAANEELKIDSEPINEQEVFPVFEIDKQQSDTPGFDKENHFKDPKQFSFEELFGHQYIETVFEKVIETKQPEKRTIINEAPSYENKTSWTAQAKMIVFSMSEKTEFEKQLFDQSTEDMNRVVSQLSTLNSLEEAKRFLDEMVKPDYNNWEGKQVYEAHFMEIVAKKFL